jgi:hypothetical protein
MYPKPISNTLLSSILVASLLALCSSVRAEPLEDVKARLDALDGKVAALEKPCAASALRSIRRSAARESRGRDLGNRHPALPAVSRSMIG